MATQGRIAPPDYQGLLDGKPRAVHDAVQLLVASVNYALQGVDRRRLLWQDVEYDSGLFGASAGTWTVAAGDMTLYRYLFADRMLTVMFHFQTTTTSAGMGSDLYLNLPLGLSAASGSFTGFCQLSSSALDEIGLVSTRAPSNEQSLVLQRADGSAWPSSETDTLMVRGSVTLEVG